MRILQAEAIDIISVRNLGIVAYRDLLSCLQRYGFDYKKLENDFILKEPSAYSFKKRIEEHNELKRNIKKFRNLLQRNKIWKLLKWNSKEKQYWKNFQINA